jgi:tetratricopeptide (TPR) repeat protein
MARGSDRHAAALAELVGRWQDLSEQKINSQALLVPVPPHWGRTHLLNEFAAVVEDDEAISIVIRVPGAALADESGLQALQLRKLFSDGDGEHRVAELLGVDRLGGITQLGLNVASLFLSPLAALVGLLLAGVGVGAAGKVWDDSLAGQEGMVARLARAVAAVSVSVPVVVIIDDSDRLELDLAVVLVENLIGRFDGRVLIVAAVDPGGDLMSALTTRAAYGLTEGRVRTVNADPDMDYQARVDLAAQLCPQLPSAAIRLIAQRTRTFAEVFAVASSERLAELDAKDDAATIVAVTGEVIDAQVNQVPPSELAVVLAWAGGILHALQAERAVKALGAERLHADDVIHFESLIRLADPASPRLAEQVRVLPASRRQRLAEIVLDTALEIGRDPNAGLVDKVVAWQAAHRVRADLQDRAQLIGVQRDLVRGLEDLNDPAAAYQIATVALAEYVANRPGEQRTSEHDDLSAAVLRLARTQERGRTDPLIAATIDAVAAGGAAVGLEARIWAAIDLLGQPDERDQALELTDQVTDEMNSQNDLGMIGNLWRLQLAFHAGRAGYPAITQKLLAPILNASSPPAGDAARAVLRVADRPGADTRLQIIGLEAELAALPPDADDDRLRLLGALTTDYANLGDYRRALGYGRQELQLGERMRGADDPYILSVRSFVAWLTGQSGNPVKALRLSRELLPEQVRVLGRDHPDTLKTQNNIACFTGESGNPAEALRLFRELAPDQVRILGPDHPSTVKTRHNIASFIAMLGNPAEALRLFQELLPDEIRVLGPDHPDTLVARNNIAGFTGESGNPAEALRLSRELLPDKMRVLGPDNPRTLNTRASIAWWTGVNGNPAEALRLSRELLPDQVRITPLPDSCQPDSSLGQSASWALIAASGLLPSQNLR